MAVESLAGLAYDTPGKSDTMNKAENFGVDMAALATSITSQLQLLDLLGETTVYDNGFAYFSVSKDQLQRTRMLWLQHG